MLQVGKSNNASRIEVSLVFFSNVKHPSVATADSEEVKEISNTIGDGGSDYIM